MTHIEKEGYLSFGKLGGLHPESILHTPVRFKSGVTGVIALRQKVAAKDMTLQDLYVDIGARNEEEARHHLNDRERHILNLRFFQGKTQMEVSAEIGISQAQVSRLEKNAINQIKRDLEPVPKARQKGGAVSHS